MDNNSTLPSPKAYVTVTGIADVMKTVGITNGYSVSNINWKMRQNPPLFTVPFRLHGGKRIWATADLIQAVADTPLQQVGTYMFPDGEEVSLNERTKN